MTTYDEWKSRDVATEGVESDDEHDPPCPESTRCTVCWPDGEP